jgi:hypothetical protein
MPTKDYDSIGEIVKTVFGDYNTYDYDPVEELLATTRGQNAFLTTTTTPKTCTCGGKCDHDKHIANLVVDHFDEIFEDMATKIIEKAVDERIGDTAFGIRTILANHKKNAFTVVWEDGESTVIHLQEGDEWDDEKALAMCFVKKLFGNKGSFNYIFTETLPSKLKVIPKEEETIWEEFENCKKTLCSSINGQLTIDDIPANGTNEEEKSYELYLVGSFTNTKRLVHRGTISELRDFIKRYAVKADLGYYFRTWNADGGMYLDYGSYTQYFFIPGITNSEYAGK